MPDRIRTPAEPYEKSVPAGFHMPAVFEVEPESGKARESFGSAVVCVPEERVAAIRAFAEAHGLPLEALIEAAWGLLLARYTREADVVFGCIPASRTTASDGADAATGPLTRSVPVRLRIDGDAALVSWLKEVADEGITGDGLGGQSLFDTLLVFEDGTTGAPLDGPDGGVVEGPAAHQHNPACDVTLTARTCPPLRLRLQYKRGHLGDAAAGRLLGHLTTLLDGMGASGPAIRLAELPLLTPAEYDEIAVNWNATDVAYPQAGQRLEALVEAQVHRTPEAVAVRFEEETLTYRDLDARANQVAHALRAAGVRPNTLVAVCLERSIELVVALLGVLKSGGAYVPLDPSDPEARLTFIAGDAGAPVIITSTGLARALHGASGTRLLIDDEATWAAQPSSRPEPAGTSADLAYVIYTSGSTGRPKGARITHRGVVNRLLWMQYGSGLEIDTTDRVLLVTPINFDPSVQELFRTLLAGARLVVARPGGHRDVRYLARLVESAAVTWMGFVPSLLGAFLDDPSAVAAARRSLRKAVCGGQVLPPELVARFAGRVGCPLYNLYGPTEATISVTGWLCDPAVRGSQVPIGHPIANTQIYLLDPWMQPVPIGVAGELCIGGVQVGLGYHNRPELTAERFVPDPFRPGPEARLYRTGDLARYRPDGAIEFLGRLDHQVKVHGYRIELGEIEAALRAHPGIREAVVVARDDPSGNRRLVAYFLAEPQITVHELRAALLTVLPRYMVPAVFVRMDALPLMLSGKVDRHALPPPPVETRDRHVPFVEPRGATEHELASRWTSILAVPRVGRDDNFFDLGGDSLQAVRLANDVQRIFGVELPLRWLLEARTLAELASLVDQTRRGDGGTAVPPAAVAGSARLEQSRGAASTLTAPAPPIVTIQPHGAGLPLFAVPGHNGDVFSYVHLARELGADRPFYALQPPGIDGRRVPLRSVDALAAYYVDAIRARHPGPYLLAGYCAGGTVVFEMACRLVEQGSEVRLLAMIGAPHPSALTIGARTVARAIHHAGLLLRWPVTHTRQLLRRMREPRDNEHPAGRHGYRVGRATVSAIGVYAPGRYPGRVTLILPNARYATSLDRPLRWQEQTAQPVERLTGPVACGRDDMLRKPHVQWLAREMRELLAHVDDGRA